MAEKIAFENGQTSNFEGLVSRDTDLESSNTACQSASHIDL